MSTILGKFRHGLGWGTASVVLTTVLQLVLMAVMARALSPLDFGLVAMANVVLRFLSYFAQIGVSPALIQKPELEAGDIGAAMTVSLTISSVCFLITVLCSPLIQLFFKAPHLAVVVSVLALNYIISGFAAVSTGLLRRKLAFRELAIMDSTAYIVGYGIVGVYLALHGGGVWSLVAASLSQAGWSALVGSVICRESLSLVHHKQQRGFFLGFGWRYSLIGFLEFFSASLDAMVVGKFFGAAASGLYNRAGLLANLSVQQPVNIFTRVLFPVMTSVGDLQKQKLGFEVSVLVVGAYAFSVSLGVSVAAPDIVQVLLGDKWLGAIPILRVLPLAVGPIFVSHVGGVALDSMGKLKAKLNVLYLLTALLVLLLVVFFPLGVVGIAYALVIAETLRALLYCGVVSRFFGIAGRDWYLIGLILAGSGLGGGGGVWLLHMLCGGMAAPALRLLADVAGGFIGLALALLVARLPLRQLDAARVMAERMPRFAKYLNY